MHLFDFLASIRRDSLIHSLLPTQLSFVTALILLVVALALIFVGRQIIGAIAFVAVGLIVAAAGAIFGTLILGIFGLVIGALLGFIVGGLLSLFLLPLAIGIGFGVIAYDLTQSLVHIYIFSIIAGLILFVVGILVAYKLLALATAIFGGLMLFNVELFFHVPVLAALVFAFVLAVIGFWVQGGLSHREGAPMYRRQRF